MKIGKEVKIGLGVIGVLLVVFGFVAWRRLADSRPPEPLAEAGETPAAGSDDSAGAAGDTSGSDNMLARMGKRPAADSDEVAQPSWSRSTAAPDEDEPSYRKQAEKHADKHEKTEKHAAEKTPARPAHRDFSSSNAFDTRPKTAAAHEATPREAAAEAAADASDEPRRLPDADDVPAYARNREKPAEEPAEEPQPKSSRRTLQVQTPATRPGHEAHEEPEAETAPPPRPERASPIAIREHPEGVREVSNHEPLARPDSYSTAPRPTPPVHSPSAYGGAAHGASVHATPAYGGARPQASGVSHDGGSPYAHSNEYNTTHSPATTSTRDYSDSTKYGAKPPESQPAPIEHRHNDRYEVKPNDSYWVIAARLYGSGAYFKALYEHNRGKYPWADKLKVGDKISAPEVAVLERDYPDLCPRPRSSAGAAARQAFHPSARPVSTGRTYQVREGDTLYDIARYELGKASRWTEIYELNRDRLADDFDYLPPGTLLAMPGSTPGTAPRPGNEPYHAREPYDADRVTGRPQPNPR